MNRLASLWTMAGMIGYLMLLGCMLRLAHGHVYWPLLADVRLIKSGRLYHRIIGQ